MIRADINESFPITISLYDENTMQNCSGAIVNYDIRTILDIELSPTISGTLTESSVSSGIYNTSISIPTAGRYVCYITSTGFISTAEEIIINEDNIANLTKQNRHYNISVQEVIRTNTTPTASQTLRKVGLGQTDYIINKVKTNSAINWNSADSGTLYAWYNTLGDVTPFKMGAST